MNGGGCSNGHFTMPADGKPCPIRPATQDSLPDDDHIGTVAPVPADKWCLDVVRGGNIETWTSALSGSRHVVALLNRSPSAEVISLSFADDLGLAASGQWLAHDVWTDASLDAAAMLDSVASPGVVNVARRVEAHGVEVMVLSEGKPAVMNAAA